MRDSRRSIGIDQFVIKITDISGGAEQIIGTAFPDRLALAAYDVDIHHIQGCPYPQYMFESYPVLPFFIPMRYKRNYTSLTLGKSIDKLQVCESVSRWKNYGAGNFCCFICKNKHFRASLSTQQLDYIPLSGLQEQLQELWRHTWSTRN
jgi:hypothetical protein